MTRVSEHYPGNSTGKSSFIYHPYGVKHVLQENHQNYDRDNPMWHRLKLFLGESILTIDGKSWLQQRRLMQLGCPAIRSSPPTPLSGYATRVGRAYPTGLPCAAGVLRRFPTALPFLKVRARSAT
jgi:hypothetical protein